ncbi:hypothetical protein PM082_001800 [Marasmius tenuissimus]|nr:hypothetical protein PM082_001800 [Marasmius tenuissimus]
MSRSTSYEVELDIWLGDRGCGRDERHRDMDIEVDAEDLGKRNQSRLAHPPSTLRPLPIHPFFRQFSDSENENHLGALVLTTADEQDKRQTSLFPIRKNRNLNNLQVESEVEAQAEQSKIEAVKREFEPSGCYLLFRQSHLIPPFYCFYHAHLPPVYHDHLYLPHVFHHNLTQPPLRHLSYGVQAPPRLDPPRDDDVGHNTPTFRSQTRI